MRRKLIHRSAVEGPGNDWHKVVDFFLKLGADPNVRDPKSGMTPLHGACEKGLMEIARSFIKYGADLKAAYQLGMRPIHSAVYCQKPELVALLLENGADIETTTAQLGTPLHLSCASEDMPPSIVQYLVTAGANLEVRDFKNCTPLALASDFTNRKDIVSCWNQGPISTIK